MLKLCYFTIVYDSVKFRKEVCGMFKKALVILTVILISFILTSSVFSFGSGTHLFIAVQW
jgi:hypothetical protein